ncbi:hypothetical protein F751_5370 [Auxenochlorella protothecoides]|uniref:Uncharacterized protein n=1 Tax=Auxenochlorella protothecoides TaxID=3075 RepID=A0A087SP60_AUXPR|nr:hypothetical protein F751_5370 [Auxenochlorella protothecoides]KFM27514.1 hypothetical protein F751_5370 [Auxenochlorella protothecoides]
MEFLFSILVHTSQMLYCLHRAWLGRKGDASHHLLRAPAERKSSQHNAAMDRAEAAQLPLSRHMPT